MCEVKSGGWVVEDEGGLALARVGSVGKGGCPFFTSSCTFSSHLGQVGRGPNVSQAFQPYHELTGRQQHTTEARSQRLAAIIVGNGGAWLRCQVYAKILWPMKSSRRVNELYFVSPPYRKRNSVLVKPKLDIGS